MAYNTELDIVQIRCIPDNRNAISGVLNTKKVRFDIETKSKDETTKRTPLNLVLILDRSGSMEANNKLTFAKQAVISVLNLLHDDDIVHLVAYDTDVSIIFENARASTRQYLYSVVNNIVTAGSTNMSGGISVGAGLLDKYVYDGFSRRMFLFSDGQANVGMRTRAELTNLVAGYNNNGIITDSFGIGADFDSEIMKGIADAGGSRFYFLESAQVIEPLVTKALVSVFGIIGSQARLIVRGQNGAIVTKIWGHENIVAGASLGDLHSHNRRSVLCEFTTSGTTNANGNEIEIDPRVRTMYVTQMVADMDKKIAQLVKDGQRKEASDLVVEQIALLKDVKKYDDERGTILELLRLAENMHDKLKDETVDRNLVYQGYQHKAYLEEDCDCGEMAFY
jgi:Ca-activated chloride channel family protein